jgi:ABC-type branched-subunit amino acid transport system ATPase component
VNGDAAGQRCLRADGITVRFGALVAVSDVSLQVGAGGAVGLIGPNGAGKSTFFNAITGFLGQSEGRLVVDGEALEGRPPWHIARAGVTRTFQNRSVFPALTVEENLTIARTAGRGSGAPRVHAFERLQDDPVWSELDMLKSSAGRQAIAGDLAYGQQRFLSVAMALATEPGYLLLDEPAAGLNASEGAVVAGLLRAARNAGIGLIVVEHDMSFLMPLVERVFVLDAGRLIADGTPAVVQADPLVRAAYLGGPEHDA